MVSGHKRCKGFCTKPNWEYADNVTKSHHSPYRKGYRRCAECEIYLNGGLVKCPCCKSILKAKPIDTKYRRKYNDDILQVVSY